MKITNVCLLILILLFCANNSSGQKSPGLFNNNADVGKVLHKGSVEYNASTQQYVISGAATNIWRTHDEFQYS